MDDLLKPSLANDRPAVPLYSARAGFFVAFFGGPLAITFFSALNSRRLGRFRQEAIFFATGVGLYLVLTFLIISGAPEQGDFLKWLAEQRRGNPLFRYGGKILALALWGGFHLLHRPFHRAMHFTGMEPPSPWKGALACLGGSFLVELPLLVGLVAWKTGLNF